MVSVDLSDRVVLVTGGAKGIGRAYALAAAESGASVVVNYHSSDAAAAATAEEAEDRGAPRAVAVQADVTDPDSVDELFDEAESALGPVDSLVNNVGDFAPKHWEDIPFEDWERVMETNFYGTYLCSKRALPAMREAEFGRIVNVGYVGADKALAYPKNFPYFVAKTGVVMFSRMLAADTQDDGVTVNTVSPYVVENSDVFPAELPRGRPASYADLTDVALFFLSENADYVSGANVTVDGGYLPETL